MSLACTGRVVGAAHELHAVLRLKVESEVRFSTLYRFSADALQTSGVLGIGRVLNQLRSDP